MRIDIKEKRFADKIIFKDESFSFPDCQCTAIIAPSGRGKEPVLSIVMVKGRQTEASIASAAISRSAALHSPRNSSVRWRFSLGEKLPEEDRSWIESRIEAIRKEGRQYGAVCRPYPAPLSRKGSGRRMRQLRR